MIRRALIVVLCGGLLAGCGAGAGSSTSKDVSVVVTRDFGAQRLNDTESSKLKKGETVMRFLQRRFEVQTRYGGGFVQSIEGLSGGKADGRSVDWFYYVNGIEAGEGAASRKISGGDKIWWDRHAWDGAQRIPAVVGSFPEPFLSGEKGKRFPVSLVCATTERTCDEVAERLGDEGVEGVSRAGIGGNFGRKVLRVLVGRWDKIRRDPAAAKLEDGPQASGVFARPVGGKFEFLDDRGKVAETGSDAVGLIAATRFEEQLPTWIITGIDDAGVDAAAANLRADVLTNRFAVAITKGRGEPLPIRSEP